MNQVDQNYYVIGDVPDKGTFVAPRTKANDHKISVKVGRASPQGRAKAFSAVADGLPILSGGEALDRGRRENGARRSRAITPFNSG